VFRDETVAYALQIWADGGVAELHVWPGGFHGYELMAPHAPLAQVSGRSGTTGSRASSGPDQALDQCLRFSRMSSTRYRGPVGPRLSVSEPMLPWLYHGREPEEEA